MKKFFSSDKGKRVLIGLGLLALAMTLGYSLQSTLLESGVRWKQAIFFLVVSGTGISGILYIFLARKGLMIGYGIFLYIAIILFFSSIDAGFTSILWALPLIIGPALVNYFAKKKNTSGKIAKKCKSTNKKPNRITGESWSQTKMENAPLLVAKRSSGSIFQVFDLNETLLFYKVGSFFKDIDEKNLKQLENLPQLGKDDFSIDIDNVTALRFHELYSDYDPFDLGINIYTKQKRHFFVTVKANCGERLQQLLQNRIPQKAQQVKSTEPHFVPTLNPRRRKIMRNVYLLVCAFAMVVGLAWSFLEVPYRLIAWLALLPTPLFLLMHYFYPNEVTLAEDKRFAHNRVMVFFALLVSEIPLMIRSYSDFNFQKPGRLILISGLLLVLLLIQAYITSEECRIRKGQLIGLAFILGVYCMSAVSLLNALLDKTPLQEKPAIVQEMRISSGKNQDFYYLDVFTSDQHEYEFRVASYLYERTQIGDTVNVLFYQGAFDIPYAEVEEIP
ncbi:MAG: hypothetical protein CVV04_06805 [Firmicutes bacterium HGW-Firmicutes-9]|nr:MAG: hypothetical protein CVV42_21075 [Candidatus Riflebacteria bacterium HGW-Riflebacteria-2]PKM39976.1 MAG: hypothetical protein CVV04_06805 [Firmicutes bacterium HGW-Firmicutes-9]